MNWIADLPFGRGRHFGKDMRGCARRHHRRLDHGGRLPLTSGFPFNVLNCRQCWTTNWDLQGNAELVTPGVLPPTAHDEGRDRRAIRARSRIRRRRSTSSGARCPGEVGLRNVLRGDGYFSIDFSLSKSVVDAVGREPEAALPVGHVQPDEHAELRRAVPRRRIPDRAATFGRYYNTIATCDGGAGRCMQFALRYEF